MDMRAGRGLVLRILIAEAAYPSYGFHALFKAREAAIVGGIARIKNRAPRIILGLGARSYCNRSDPDSQ
jgi:hypothetical protein